MPIIKSAKKALRQNKRRRLLNLKKEKKIKALIKKVRLLVSEKKVKEAKDMLAQVYKALDKAAKTKVIKKGTASRKKSRITKLINKSANPPKNSK